MPVLVWQLFVFVVRWAIANPGKAVLLEVGAEKFAGIEEGLMKRFRDAIAGMLNHLSGGEFNVTGADFESWRNFKVALSREIAGRAGIVLRDITDKKMVKEDLESHALGMIEGRTGYRISSLSNVEAMKGDLVKIGIGLVGEKTGIALTDLSSVEAIKEDLLAWGQGEIMSRISKDLESALNVEHSNGVSLMSYMKQVTGRDIKPSELLRGVQASAMGTFEKEQKRVEPLTKAARRVIQNRINQQKFRDRHAGEETPKRERSGTGVYVPVGWSYVLVDKEGGRH